MNKDMVEFCKEIVREQAGPIGYIISLDQINDKFKPFMVRPNRPFSIYLNTLTNEYIILGYDSSGCLCYHDTYDNQKDAETKYLAIKEAYGERDQV